MWANLAGFEHRRLGSFEMELMRQLSNPEAVDRLARAMKIVETCHKRPVALEAAALQHGWVRREVLRVLSEATAPMTPTEIHGAVQDEFPSRLVRYATVKSALCDEMRKREPRVQRSARGRYEIASLDTA